MEKKIQLNLETILRECSNNTLLSREHFYYFSLENRENIHEIFKYKKFNDDFTSTLSCNREEGYIIGHIGPSYNEFLEKLIKILNLEYSDDIKDDDNLTKKLLERIEVLKSIKTENDLLKEFPLLHKDLINGRRYYNDLQKVRKQEGYSEEQLASGEHYYYSCALKKNLHNFIETQTVMYTRYVTDRKKLKDLQSTKSYNAYIKKNFNMPKLYMYVMHEYLSYCEKTDSFKDIKYYLNLVKKYLDSGIDKNVHIVTNDGLYIDIDNIKERFYDLEKKTTQESKLVEWVLVPQGRDYTRVASTTHRRKIKISPEELERLRSVGEDKNNYYESTPYKIKAIGLKRYRGYVAYIYENGQVILDREFNIMHPRSAEGDAIYNIKSEDFESLSKENKKVLMKHPRVKRIVHTKTWQDKVDEIINREGTEEEKTSTKQLIKRMQTKRSN